MQDADRVRLLTVPERLRSADLTVGVRPVRGLLVLLALTVCVLGARWWWVEHEAAAVPVTQAGAVEQEGASALGEVEGGGTAAPPTSSPTGSSAGGAGDGVGAEGAEGAEGAGGAGGQDPSVAEVVEPADAPVWVHVVGQVRRPGVVELPAGARVVDAVDAAGGFTDEADVGSVNLARPVVDGEQVWVAAPGEEPPPAQAVGPGAGGSPGQAGGASGALPSEPAPLDLNTATQQELETLPGVGPVTAGKILTWRQEHGRFSTVSELLEVSGIGERTLEELEPWVRVGR